MAKKIFIGTATAVAQVDTFTPANVEIDDVFTLTATGEDGSTVAISFTATAATVANVTAGLVAAWNASTDALCTGITAADNTTNLTLTADTAGVPFYVAATTTDGGVADTQTLARAATTANSGPNDWNTAANWSTETVPVDDDDVYFEDCNVDVLYGLDQSAVTLTSLSVSQTFTGSIGYTDMYLQIASATADLGVYYGSLSPVGSTRININFLTTEVAVTVHNSAITAADQYAQPIQLLCTNADSTIRVRKGKVGIATLLPTETSTIGTIYVDYISNVDNDADVRIGEGVTLTTLNKAGGAVTCLSSISTVKSHAGTLTVAGSATVGNYYLYGGTVTHAGGNVSTLDAKGGMFYHISGNIPHIYCYRGGTIDGTRSSLVRTWSALSMQAGADVRYPTSINIVALTPDPNLRIRTDDL